jgi:hypothetical protein
MHGNMSVTKKVIFFKTSNPRETLSQQTENFRLGYNYVEEYFVFVTNLANSSLFCEQMDQQLTEAQYASAM